VAVLVHGDSVDEVVADDGAAVEVNVRRQDTGVQDVSADGVGDGVVVASSL